MDDPRWLRLIAVGLVLAALAVGYFLLTGRFTSNKQADRAVPTPQPTIIPSVPPSPEAVDLYGNVGVDSQSTPSATSSPITDIYTLPRTGNPQAFLAVIALGIMVSGLGLRKFPH